jgi:hypothetical protein
MSIENLWLSCGKGEIKDSKEKTQETNKKLLGEVATGL